MTQKNQKTAKTEADAKEIETVYTYEDSLMQRYGEIPPPNLIFVGRRWLNGEWLPKDPPSSLTIANVEIDLPDADVQRKGFFLEAERADLIIKTFPQNYKYFISKGEKS